MTDTEALKALRELVADLEESERLGIVDYSKETAIRVSKCLPHLKALLGEQREAQGEPVAWMLHYSTGSSAAVFSIGAILPDNLKAEATDGMWWEPLYSAPPLAEPDVEALLSQEPGEAQKPVAWKVPQIISFKGALKVSPESARELEGEVKWELSFIGDANPKTDKHGVTHYPIPLFASPVTDGGEGK